MAATKPSNQLALSFDYGELPAADIRACESDAKKVNRATGKALAAVIEIGEALQDVHDRLANHKNGMFGAWIDAYCAFSQRSAFRYINVAKWIGPYSARLAEYSLDIEAAYLLSSDNCPEAATKEALKLAEKGEQITKARAKEIIDSYTVDSDDVDVESCDEDDQFDWMEAEGYLHEAIEAVLKKWPNDDRDRCLNVARVALQNALNQLEGFL